MNEQDKLEVKDLLKEALEERSLEYTNKRRFKLSRKDFKDFFSNKVNKLLMPILLLTFVLSFYLLNNEVITKEITKEIIVEKIIKEDFDKTKLVFKDLPFNIKESYVHINKYDKLVKKLKEVPTINQKESKNPEVLNKKIALLQNNLNKMHKKVKNQKFTSMTCYDTKTGTKNLSNTCKNKLKKFFLKNKNTTVRFQIIPLLDKKDEKTFTSIKSKSKQEFLKLGLSRARVLEAAWLVKDTLGKEALITYVNYIAQSKQGRGVIIRAYK